MHLNANSYTKYFEGYCFLKIQNKKALANSFDMQKDKFLNNSYVRFYEGINP